MADIAALGLRVDGIDNVDKATAALQGLSVAEASAKKAADGLSASAKQFKPGMDAVAAATAKAAAEQAKFEKMAAQSGMSVKQLQFALRGVPAQFTDIAVSLQGGMNPLTVFLQQGGQLKDMFGGAVPAARALGGYVLGLINPFTLAAAAVATLGVAYFSGSKEADAFRLSVVSTGNAAGVTVSELEAMADAMGDVRGTTGAAAEALAVMVGAGVRAGNELQRYTETALRWSKATGEGVDVVAERFVALQKDPMTAALKLNESTNFLTKSVYEQIKALEEQGKASEASAAAMDAYEAAMREGAENIEQNLGSIERGWKAISGAAKDAWDWMLNIGRQASLTERLAEEQEKLVKMETEVVGLYERGTYAKRLKDQRDRVTLLMDEVAAEKINAEAKAEAARQVEAAAAWDKEANKHLDDKVKLERELASVRQKGLAAGKSENEIQAIQNKLIDDYNKKNKKPGNSSGISELAQIQSRVAATQQYIKALQEQGSQAERITEGERLAYKIQQEIDSGKLSSSQLVQKQKELEAAKTLQVAEEQVRAEQKRIEMVERAVKAEADRQNAIAESEARLQAQRDKQNADLATYGMGAQEAKAMQDRLRLQREQEKQIADMRKQYGEELRKAETDAERAQLEAMFDERLTLTQDAFSQELSLYDEYIEQKRVKESDYMAGFQASLETYLENSQNLYALAGEQMTGFLNNTQTNFSNAFMSMIDGSRSVGDAMTDMARSMGQSVIRALTDMAAQWLVYQAVQLAVGKTTQSAGASALAANANASALQAGINAFSSTAAIPIVGPGLAPAAMGSALAVTMPMAAAVSALALTGMAHDGIDSIPEEGTWLLNKGERVTTANTSAKLDATLGRIDRQTQNGGLGGSKVTVNVVEDAQRAGTTERSTGLDQEEIISIFVANIRSGGEAADALESTYQLGRAGR